MKKLWLLAPIFVPLVYFGSKPFLVVHSLKASIVSRDEKALRNYVDFDRLRASYVAEHGDAIAEAGLTDTALGRDGIKDIRDVAGDYISPQGFVAMGQRGELGFPQPFSGASYSYLSASQFRVAIKPKPGTSQAFALILTRHGVRWKVTTMDYIY